jgi:hypothetical protein
MSKILVFLFSFILEFGFALLTIAIVGASIIFGIWIYKNQHIPIQIKWVLFGISVVAVFILF